MGLKKFKDIFFSRKAKAQESPTNNFLDSTTGLLWKSITRETSELFPREFEEMHDWSSDEQIQRYIASRKTLDSVIKMITPSDGGMGKMFFCYEKDQFIGLVYTSTPTQENDATIEYVITNPNIRKKGYATMMISSVLQNKDYFFSKDFDSEIKASIEKQNIPSQKAFTKNGFVQDKDESYVSSGRLYNVFYSKPRISTKKEIPNTSQDFQR